MRGPSTPPKDSASEALSAVLACSHCSTDCDQDERRMVWL